MRKILGMPMTLQNKTFTMVEMLIVMIIILFLATLLLPMLSVSRKQAQKTNCISNLKQMAISTRLYADEQGYYPPTSRQVPDGTVYWCAFSDGTNVDFERSPLKDYIKNFNVLKCPVFRGGYQSMDSNMDSTCSYGINAEYVGGSPDPNGAPTETDILNSTPAKLSDIKSPDKTMIYMDSAVINLGQLSESYYFWARYSYVTAVSHGARTHFRHGKVAVGVFCDGHVNDSIFPDAISDETNRIGWPDINMCLR